MAEAVRDGLANGTLDHSILDNLLYARLTLNNPHKVYLAIELVRMVRGPAHACVRSCVGCQPHVLGSKLGGLHLLRVYRGHTALAGELLLPAGRAACLHAHGLQDVYSQCPAWGQRAPACPVATPCPLRCLPASSHGLKWHACQLTHKPAPLSIAASGHCPGLPMPAHSTHQAWSWLAQVSVSFRRGRTWRTRDAPDLTLCAAAAGAHQPDSAGCSMAQTSQVEHM